jgi:ADP-heptose:LPS heptosyltransferase
MRPSDTRLLVLFPGALGDLCLLAPALADAVERGARVELCVQRSLVPLARLLLPRVVIGPSMDGAVMSSLFAAALDPALVTALGRAEHVHAWLARADGDGRLGERFAELGVSATLHAVPRSDAAHHVVLDYAAMLGLPEAPAPLRFTAPSASFALPWGATGADRLLIHPGAGGSAKIWAIDAFRRLAEHWRADGGEAAVLLGPAEEQQAPVWERSDHAVLTGLSILDTSAAIASAGWWLGNDSGMSHVAGALDRRGVVLFGPTRASRWRPFGGRLAAVDFAGRDPELVVGDVRAHLGVPFPRP